MAQEHFVKLMSVNTVHLQINDLLLFVLQRFWESQLYFSIVSTYISGIEHLSHWGFEAVQTMILAYCTINVYCY